MSSSPATAKIIPVSSPLRGRVTLPGSKSVTNRALLVAALAEGKSRLSGILRSDDTHYMIAALRAMDIGIEEVDDTTLDVTGRGGLSAPAAPVFLGNAGTAVRFLTAASALIDGNVTITGDEHMRKRPIAPLIDTLRAMGVAAMSETGCPPVHIDGTGRFTSGDIAVSGSLSSQYISAIMMLAAMGEAETRIHIEGGKIGAVGYLHITAAVMRSFGAEVDIVENGRITLQPGGYRPCDYDVEPDASAATYLWAAGKLTGGAIDIGAKAQELNQPDAAAHDYIAAFPNMPVEIEGSQMQDAVPTLAVLAAFNRTQVRFKGIANLRVKECDRITALHDGLTRIRAGLATVEGDDLLIHADPSLMGQTRPARIDSYADHRIAMCFSLAGLVMHGIEIEDPMCVSKTFPDYWDVLRHLGVRIDMTG